MIRKNPKILVTFAAALAVGVGVGAAVASAASSQRTSPLGTVGDVIQSANARPNLSPQSAQRNASGLTYGPSGQGALPSDDPDLVLIVATNGATGYAYKSALAGVQPSSPSEAANLPQTWTVPVYLSDGETKIGEFVVGQGLRP